MGAEHMTAPLRAVDVIRKKRDGKTLTPEEIAFFVQGAVSGVGWAPYQVAAMLMAIFFRGMNLEETTRLTEEMVASGQRWDWSDLPGPVVDKHSTGGVGDKTSLILAPLAAACGVYVPMMSGRGLGHTGGTLDKLEAIPGFRVDWEPEQVRRILRETGLVMIGPTATMAPADRILYALRDVTATVESIPLITASILSKKIAEGITALVLDVKCGRGAFMKNRSEAEALALSLQQVGTAAGLRLKTFLTAMDAPLGTCIGNALEVKEAIETLQGRGPDDLTELSVQLAAQMVFLGGLTESFVQAEDKVRQALHSGQGLEWFRRCVKQQGGDPRVIDQPEMLPQAPHVLPVCGQRSGYVTALQADLLGQAAMVLGAGRAQMEETVDPAVGIVCRVRPGQKVSSGDCLLEVHYRHPQRLEAALPLIEQAVILDDVLPSALPNQPLILHVWGDSSED
jgi:pyrimidine-nucleoside phosphorylase